MPFRQGGRKAVETAGRTGLQARGRRNQIEADRPRFQQFITPIRSFGHDSL